MLPNISTWCSGSSSGKELPPASVWSGPGQAWDECSWPTPSYRSVAVALPMLGRAAILSPVLGQSGVPPRHYRYDMSAQSIEVRPFAERPGGIARRSQRRDWTHGDTRLKPAKRDGDLPADADPTALASYVATVSKAIGAGSRGAPAARTCAPSSSTPRLADPVDLGHA
jgi:hypothetical protein